MNLRQLLADLARFPWLSTAQTLRERFREDRLGLSASSLTFTTTIALVPFFTVALALFTAFPMFGKLQANLQGWLVQSLVPDIHRAPGAGLPHPVRGQGQPAGRRSASPRWWSARWRWCSPSTARSTASGACAGRGRWRSGC
jgi:hypothetical protein